MEIFDRGFVVSVLGDNLGNGLSTYFPLLLAEGDLNVSRQYSRINLSSNAVRYISSLGCPEQDLFFHVVATLHSSIFRTRNQSALRQDWPRIPLPAKKTDLLASAALGRRVAALLDTEHPVDGISAGTIRPELQKIAVIARVGGGALHPGTDDLAVTAGWGHAGKGGVTMPGRGKTVDGDPAGILEALGRPVFDVHLNDVAFWKSVPHRVWEYTIGGYQVIKKWLSYREHALLGRPITIEEARYVTDMARRLAALVLLESELDANYQRVTAATYPWPRE